jgi:hypothetical protein
MSDTSGEIPQSNALSEASAESLGELLTRDPFGFTRQDRDRVVADLRVMRAKWALSESMGTKKRSGASAKVDITKVKIDLDTLDL